MSHRPLHVLFGFLAAIMAFAAGTATAQVYAVTRVEPGVNRIGQQDADMRLTEYVSYTCPHCAHFEQEAGDILKLAYIGNGRIQVEIRNLVRDPFDLTAAMLANCGSKARFSAVHAMLMREQPRWLEALQAATVAQRARYHTGTQTARRQAIARDAGFYRLMARHGFDVVDVDRCLRDDAMAHALAEKTAQYREEGVTGTPSFAVDGTILLATHDWTALQPQIDARLKP